MLPNLEDRYAVTWCHHADEAAAVLQQDFDGLVLDLFLPGIDGLFLLQTLQDRLPPVVLALTPFYSSYVLQAAEELGAGYVLRYPFTPSLFYERLEDMFRKQESPLPTPALSSPHYHLQRLGLCSGKKGYRCLAAILPSYDPRTSPCLFNDFYPDLAARDSVTMAAIDNAIHREIRRAYDHRQDPIWREYFPDTSRCPTNKAFLTAVADRIRQKSPS